MNSFACGELKQHCPFSRDLAQNLGTGKMGRYLVNRILKIFGYLEA